MREYSRTQKHLLSKSRRSLSSYTNKVLLNIDFLENVCRIFLKFLREKKISHLFTVTETRNAKENEQNDKVQELGI